MTEREQPNLLHVFKSVLASFFGVQSSKARERDFTHGKPAHYIIVGVILTAIFILTVWSVVKLVLHLSGV